MKLTTWEYRHIYTASRLFREFQLIQFSNSERKNSVNKLNNFVKKVKKACKLTNWENSAEYLVSQNYQNLKKKKQQKG